MAEPTLSKNPVYVTIFRRLALLSPPINIEDHIANDPHPNRKPYKHGDPAFPPTETTLKIQSTTLGGIQFVAKDSKKLVNLFKSVNTTAGYDIFAIGTSGDRDNLALAASFGQTHGIGFREIWRLKLSERAFYLDPNGEPYYQLRDRRFAAKFNDSVQTQTSLHCAVAPDICDIHIDEMGFVMTDAKGSVVLNPDFAQHAANELLFKTFLKNKLPQILLDRTSFSFLNSTHGYRLGFGISGDLVQTNKYRLRVTGSCSYEGKAECSGTLSFSGSFGSPSDR